MNFPPTSPRSSNYERLENGYGPSKMTGFRKFGWKKFVIGAVVIIGFVWVLGPRREDLIPEGYEEYLPSSQPTSTTKEQESSAPATPPTHHNEDNIPAPVPHPTSIDTDPDPSKTVHCSKPYKPDVPLVQYALMIDAGSTGSRIHIYKFHNCDSSPTYEYEVFHKTQPGLSSYRGKPLEAAQSLDVLLDEAVKVVPKQMHSCTPVAVKATAGLRLLGVGESEEILEAVRHRLHEKYPFALQDKDGVVIMDGKDEGVYAWITANYLLGTIRPDSPKDTTPYAVLDLGGASTQIVFEPTFDMSKPDSTLEPGEHKYDLKFAGKDHTLYQHSYLGYGLMSARQSIHRLVHFMGTFRAPAKGDIIPNPCLAKGTKRAVELKEEGKTVTMVGEDIGSFEACNRVVELVMAKDAICEVKPCSFNGVYQPSLLETFPRGKILLLSYFYDRLQPLLTSIRTPLLASPSSPSSTSPTSNPTVHVDTIAELAKRVCLGKSSWIEHWGSSRETMDELEGRPEYCLDLTFMHALLRLGYEFGGEREVEIGKQIDGTELGWCLGATIAMVGAELKCRA
ncbi:hypothetical protein K474DRAFT_1604899 [Panus rudis PR-1116 ss-1]|nr:hypothetical protein K474DRAFT_1604899 [Panus rudis PR-1116 ss-1]